MVAALVLTFMQPPTPAWQFALSTFTHLPMPIQPSASDAMLAALNAQEPDLPNAPNANKLPT
jgi:hypothetical protein